MSCAVNGSRSEQSAPYASLLTYNREMALSLPAPDEDFALAESSLSLSSIKRLEKAGVVRRLDRERVSDNGGQDYLRWRWETTEPAYEWIQRHFDTDAPECPAEDCHSTGVRCLEPQERYACSNDDCAETFGPETARELIGR